MSGSYSPPRRYGSPPQQQHPAQPPYPEQYGAPQDPYGAPQDPYGAPAPNNYQIPPAGIIPPAGTIPPAGSYLNQPYNTSRPTSSNSNRPGSAHSNSRSYSPSGRAYSPNPNPHHANPHHPHAAPASQFYPHEHNCPPDHTAAYNAPPNARSDFGANTYTPHSGIPPAGAPYGKPSSPAQQYGHGPPPHGGIPPAGSAYGQPSSPPQQYSHGTPPLPQMEGRQTPTVPGAFPGTPPVPREEQPPKFIAQQGRTFTTMLGKKAEKDKGEGIWGKLFG